MIKNRLLINNDKTEFLTIGQQLQKINIPHTRIGKADIFLASHVKNLGYMFYSNMTMDRHVLMTCKAAFYTITIVFASIETRGHYSLLPMPLSPAAWIPVMVYSMVPLQLPTLKNYSENVAAILATGSPKLCHMKPQLNWLSIRYRIQYKILLLTFKHIHGLALSSLHISLLSRHHAEPSISQDATNTW